MANQQLVDYLISLQSTKHSKQQIKNVLLEVGWPHHEVQEAFRVAQEHHEIFHPRLSSQQTSSMFQIVAMILVFMAGTFIIFNDDSQPTGHTIAELQNTKIQETQGQTDQQFTKVFEAPNEQLMEVEQTFASASVTVEEITTEAPKAEEISSQEISIQAKVMAQVQEMENKEQQKSSQPSCETLSGSQKDECFATLALQTGRTEDCNRIRNLESHSGCISVIAVKNLDKSLCQKTKLSDDCYLNYAISTKDESACIKLISSAQRQVCQNLA